MQMKAIGEAAGAKANGKAANTIEPNGNGRLFGGHGGAADGDARTADVSGQAREVSNRLIGFQNGSLR